jgi:hypothetical protein
MYSLFHYIFALQVSGAICSHPQEHKLQSTAIGMCNVYGMLTHWSRYWLGHSHTFSITCSSSGGATQAVVNILCACYVSWLHQDWSG